MNDRLLFGFWAKSSAGGRPHHPVLHHLLDAGAVALTLLESGLHRPPVSDGVDARSLAFLVALHDLGKFTRNFQAQARDLWPTALGPPPALDPAPLPRHEAATHARLTEGAVAEAVRARLFHDWRPASAPRALLRAVAYHHGRPNPSDAPLVTCPACDAAALAATETLLAILNPPPLPCLTWEQSAALAWWLAGFAILADWVASNAEWFVPRGDAPPPAAAYWRDEALPRARDAIAAAGLRGGLRAGPCAMGTLFPGIAAPSPLQRWAEQVPLGEGPALFVVEDVTGAGKTEAALLLAQRLVASGRVGGLFLALPTMATANAAYARLAAAEARFFDAASGKPSLVLAHGRRGDHAAFRRSVRPPGEAEEGAAAQCAAWLADDRRRCFLAELGAGTVDQALLAVLPVRHAMLRLLGLSRRVLVVDEAHAYDAYMREELATLLRFQAALGGSAILLSATLPLDTRRKLVGAFAEGLGSAPPALGETAYPLTTSVSRGHAAEEPCGMRAGLARRVAVGRVADAEEATLRVLEASRRGAAVAWVRNTVGDAADAAAALRAAGAEPLLFHARFAMGDRLALEEEVLRRFGPRSGAEERRGGIVVATQVVEQSLDLDFDLLVTDLAPADLVIQRAGRLWRHDRPGQRPVEGPRLLLLSPPAEAEPPAGWPGAAFRGTTAVYGDPALLWRSARALLGASVIETPGNVRALVEAAYEAADVPPALAREAERADGKAMAARGTAAINLLRLQDAYGGGPREWPTDHRVPTRLGEESVLLRLALWKGGCLRPLVEAGERSWPLSEVVVPRRRLEGPAPDAEVSQALATLRAGWTEWEREIAVLALRPAGADAWVGRALGAGGREAEVRYGRASGLEFVTEVRSA